MRKLSNEHVAPSLAFELVVDVLEPFTAGVCEGEWCDWRQAELTVRLVDISLCLSALSQSVSNSDTEELSQLCVLRMRRGVFCLQSPSY